MSHLVLTKAGESQNNGTPQRVNVSLHRGREYAPDAERIADILAARFGQACFGESLEFYAEDGVVFFVWYQEGMDCMSPGQSDSGTCEFRSEWEAATSSSYKRYEE